MTKREDVIPAEAGKRGRLIYTCNCGGIDMTHARTKTTRANVGAESLWDQVKSERGLRSKKTGESGFKVTYIQDMGRGSLTVGSTGNYFVRSGLSVGEKESVALAIFMEISLEFETFQDSIRPFSNSGFSQEDLVSNLISFYCAVRPRESTTPGGRYCDIAYSLWGLTRPSIYTKRRTVQERRSTSRPGCTTSSYIRS